MSDDIYRGFQDHLRVTGRRLNTRHGYLNIVSRYLCDNPDPWAVSLAGIERWLASTGWTDDTQRKARVTLRLLFRWAETVGLAASVPTLALMEHRSGPARAAAPAGWGRHVEAWCGWLAAGGQSPNTVRVRMFQLLYSARELGTDPWAVTQAEIVALIGAAQAGAATRKGRRDALRSFYEWAVYSGHLDASPAANLPRIRVPVGIPRPAPTAAVLTALECADDRTRLAICLGMYAGLRRMEIAKVHTRDIRDGSLYVIGKGGKHRLVPVHPDLSTELDAVIHRMSVNGWRYDGWLFPSQQGGHLSAGHIGKLIANALPDGWTTHTLRHRFASQAYAYGGRDLIAVQTLLGHSKPETTARYTAVPDGALTDAVAGVGLR